MITLGSLFDGIGGFPFDNETERLGTALAVGPDHGRGECPPSFLQQRRRGFPNGTRRNNPTGRSILRRWRVLDARLCSAEHNFLNVKLRKMLSHLLKCSKASKNAPAGFTLSIICPSRKNEVHHHSDGRPHS